MESTKLRAPDPYVELANKTIGRIRKLERGEQVALKRTIGLTVDELKQEDRIRFYSLFPLDKEIPNYKDLLNCILLGAQVVCMQEGKYVTNVLMQDVLYDSYVNSKSKSFKTRIVSFMSEDGRGNEMFFKDLSMLVQSLLRKQEVNVFALTNDLINWDKGGKDKWLNCIVRIKRNELTTKEDTENNEGE